MGLLSEDQSLLDEENAPPSGEPKDTGGTAGDESGSTLNPPANDAFDKEYAESVFADAATREDDEYDSSYEGERKLVQQNFTYPTHADPARRVDATGVYLDDVQRVNAEVQRAAVEGREPDLENPPAIQGTPLIPTHVVKSQLPGDWVVEPDKQLPVSVGTPKDDKKNKDDE